MSRIMNDHIAPFDLVRYVDDELSPSEQQAVGQHLESCPQCSQSLASARASLSGVSEVVQSATSISMYDAASEARLRARLQEMIAEERTRNAWHPGLLPLLRQYAGFAVLLLITAVFIAGFVMRRAHRTSAEAVLLPNRSLTPGAVREVALSDICQVEDDDDLDPVVSVLTQKTIFKEYGIPPEESRVNFQMDYLINPQLGGINDVRNLWPQPYSSEWNASAKDALERHLHQMVCEHKIELADAQREIAENWIDAYKKYFHTSKPI